MRNDTPTPITRRQALRVGAALWLAPALAAQAQHGGHEAAAASAPRTARRPRPPLGMGAALAPDGALWVVMLDSTGRLQLQTSTDLGRHWTAPRPLDTAGDPVSADGENHPKIAFGRGGQVVVAYTQPLARPNTGQVRLLRSTDAGASFAPPVTVHRDRQVITHRFESIAFDARGVLHVVWIDKRDLEAAQAAGQAYAGAAIYRNESADGGASFGPDLKVADHSCECCRIALAPTPEGGVAAMWRHVWPVNLRDHAFARLGGTGDASAPAARGAGPVRASQDGWVVQGCPHHGPGLAPAADGGWHAVWFGVRDGQPGVRHGRLDAAGAPHGNARLLPDAAADHASVATLGPRVAIVWRGFDGEATRWRAWLSEDDGARFTLRELGHSRAENDHPRLVSDGHRVLALWRLADEGVRVVQVL
ncbi:MAG: exo-alpha-sialidase [Burkholderiales bacterium]|nr:exo-alpha-sialidase [Burkholderiales bacterium]